METTLKRRGRVFSVATAIVALRWTLLTSNEKRLISRMASSLSPLFNCLKVRLELVLASSDKTPYFVKDLLKTCLGTFCLVYFLMLKYRLETYYLGLVSLESVSITVPDLFQYDLTISSALPRHHYIFS